MADVQIIATLGDMPIDITDYYDAGAPLTIKRGRPHELATTDSGEASFTLVNDDGRFTPGHAGGEYYPAVKRWVPVQIYDAAGAQIFGGYVDIWSVGMTLTGETATTGVTCADRMTLDALRTLESLAREAILARSPLAYWDLTVEQSGGDQATSIVPAPTLAAKYSGVVDGELDWGGGIQLPADAASGTRFAPVVNAANLPAGGWRLEATYTPPTSYSVLICYGAPTHDGPLLRVGTVALDIVAGVVKWPGVRADRSDALQLAGVCEIISIDAAGAVLSSDPTRTPRTTPASSTTIQVAGDGTNWAGASVSHIAVLPWLDPTPGGPMDRLLGLLRRDPLDVRIVLEDLLAISGAGASPVALRGNPLTVRIPQVSGGSAQDAIDQIAIAALGRYHIAKDGTPTWTSYDYLPDLVPWPTTAEISEDATYEPELGAYVTDVTTALPSGGQWTYSDADGLARPSIQIDAILATDAACRAAATWIVDRSSDLPRLKGLLIDLLALPPADPATLATLDIGTRLTIDDLPQQIPSPQAVIVEGITWTRTVDTWTVALDTSPDLSPGGWFSWGMAWGQAPWKPI